jgi:early secretory antigenic target protein ESAT-6
MSSGKKVTVWTGDVADTALAILHEANDLEAQLSSLTSAMANLAVTWTGPASSAFQNVYETWKGAAQQATQTLKEVRTSLSNAGTQYEETEDALRSLWT